MDLSASQWSYLIPISLMGGMLLFPALQFLAKLTDKDEKKRLGK